MFRTFSESEKKRKRYEIAKKYFAKHLEQDQPDACVADSRRYKWLKKNLPFWCLDLETMKGIDWYMRLDSRWSAKLGEWISTDDVPWTTIESYEKAFSEYISDYANTIIGTWLREGK